MKFYLGKLGAFVWATADTNAPIQLCYSTIDTNVAYTVTVTLLTDEHC